MLESSSLLMSQAEDHVQHTRSQMPSTTSRYSLETSSCDQLAVEVDQVEQHIFIDFIGFISCRLSTTKVSKVEQFSFARKSSSTDSISS